MKLFDDCPSNLHCGPWREGIDVRLCVRCGKEIPDVEDEDARRGAALRHHSENRQDGVVQ